MITEQQLQNIRVWFAHSENASVPAYEAALLMLDEIEKLRALLLRMNKDGEPCCTTRKESSTGAHHDEDCVVREYVGGGT